MRWPRTRRNSRLPTAVSALAVAAAIALVESMQKKLIQNKKGHVEASKTSFNASRNLVDLSGRSNEDLARRVLLTLIGD